MSAGAMEDVPGEAARTLATSAGSGQSPEKEPEATVVQGGDLTEFLSSGDDWPEATVAETKAEEWPAAVEVKTDGSGYGDARSFAASGGPSSFVTGTASSSSASPAPDKAAPGLRRFIAELSSQLAEEVKRREQEEEELERRAAEKRRLLEDLDLVRKQKEKLDFEQRADEAAAEEIEQQHSKLAEEHQMLRQEVAKQETQLQQLREEAKARTGQGRDWARDGPEKDALVETKLRIAEAHDELAQLRQQLWLNREGLKRQLAELQAENMRLRTGRSPLQ